MSLPTLPELGSLDFSYRAGPFFRGAAGPAVLPASLDYTYQAGPLGFMSADEPGQGTPAPAVFLWAAGTLESEEEATPAVSVSLWSAGAPGSSKQHSGSSAASPWTAEAIGSTEGSSPASATATWVVAAPTSAKQDSPSSADSSWLAPSPLQRAKHSYYARYATPFLLGDYTDAGSETFTVPSPPAESFLPNVRIAVDQAPSNGTRYPFLEADAQLRAKILDFYLSLEANSNLQLPFRLQAAYGLGDMPNPDVTMPGEATHDADIWIVDADGAPVFDSTVETVAFDLRAWTGTQRKFVEWVDRTQRIFCRLVWDASVREESHRDITPDAPLDPRTIDMQPYRVKRVRFRTHGRYDSNLIILEDRDETFILRAGNNCRLRTERVAGANLLRPRTRVYFDAISGAGAGPASTCDNGGDETMPLLSINKTVFPDEQGRIKLRSLEQNDCAWVNIPTIEAGEGVRRVSPGSTLDFNDACRPCCNPEDFVNVYQSLVASLTMLKETGVAVEAIRDELNAVKSVVWETHAMLRSDIPADSVDRLPSVDLVCTAEGCAVHIAVTYKNLTLTESTGSPSITLSATISAGTVRTMDVPGRFASLGGEPFGSVTHDFVATQPLFRPGESVSMYLTVDFTGCADNDIVGIHAVGEAPGLPSREERRLVRLFL